MTYSEFTPVEKEIDNHLADFPDSFPNLAEANFVSNFRSD